MGNMLAFICPSGPAEGSWTNPLDTDAGVKHNGWITMISIAMDLERLEEIWPLTTFLSNIYMCSEITLLKVSEEHVPNRALSPRAAAGGLYSQPGDVLVFSCPLKGTLWAAVVCFHPIHHPHPPCPPSFLPFNSCRVSWRADTKSSSQRLSLSFINWGIDMPLAAWWNLFPRVEFESFQL